MVGLALFFITPWGTAQVADKNVLVLYSHERELPSYNQFDSGLRSELGSAVVLYTEYLDLMRFPEENQQEIANYLRVKYSSKRIDLIVVVSPLALNFVLQNADALFPTIPVVFASVNIHTLQQLSIKPNITGIAVKREIAETLDTALKVQPDTRNLIVLAGGSQLERSWTEGLQKSLRPYEARLSITYLGDLSMDSMLQKLKDLPPHTIILFAPLFYFDGDGRYFQPEEALKIICRSSNSPVYGTDETYMGIGIVGGHLYDLGKVGAAAGRMGKRVLAGESPANLPVETLDPNSDVFDARQLKRWGISEARLPPGSVLQFDQQSPWALYKGYILGCMALFLVESFLVIALIGQSRRLKQSELTQKKLSHHLINAQEEERKRIARDLHDDFSQRLALLRIELCAATEEQGALATSRLLGLGSTVDALLEDIHHLSRSLHSSKLQYLGLNPALKDLCAQVAKTYPISVEFQAAEPIQAIPEEVALCVYRVAQEALSNAVKYSGASKVVVELTNGNSGLALRIVDSGKGFDTSMAQEGLGLMSMRERLLLVNGTLLVTSTPGGGVELVAKVNLAQPGQPLKAQEKSVGESEAA